MILPIAAGMLAVNAGAAVSATSAADMENLKNSAGCYEISTRENLVGFANIVNGTDGYTRNVSACGVLTKDIYYNETQVVNDALTDLANGTPANVWTPIGKDDNHPFQGSIDGQGHTIYGLYMNNSQDWDASLVSVALPGTVVKNLRVEDSFFKSSSGGNGGIIGKASAGAVLVENCSFKGRIEGGTNNGGIVGSVQNNASLTLKDCYNEGSINGSKQVGGLVGMMGKDPSDNKLSLENCFNVGSAVNNPLVGENQTGKDGNISAQNVGCVSTKTGTIFKTESCNSVVKNNVTIADSATLALNFLNNKSGASETKAEWDKLTNSEKAERINNSVSGIEVDSVRTTSGKWITRTTIKTKVELGNVDTLLIKEDVVADSLVYDRQFEEGVASTIMVPFNYSVSASMKAKFYEFTDVVQDAEGAWKVNAKQVTVLKAHTPYLVMPTANGTLTFVGPFVLFANNNGAAYEVSIGSTAWKAVGVYTKKRWDTGVNENEIGTIYGFAAEAKSEKNPGDFVRGGKKVAILPMRSYLKYDASADEETVVSTPALTKVRAISSTEIASVDALPQRLVVELEDAPERIESIEVPDVSEEGEIQEGQDDVMGIAKNPMIRLDAQKADRWFNVNGRNMNAKPKSQGAFIKNSTPVIVK